MSSQPYSLPQNTHAALNPRSAAVCIAGVTLLPPPPSRLPPLLSQQGTFTDDAVIVSMGVYCGNFASDDQRAFLSVVYAYSKRHLYSRPPREGCEIYAATYLGPTSWYRAAPCLCGLLPTISPFPLLLVQLCSLFRKGKAAAGITPGPPGRPSPLTAHLS